MKIKPKSFVPFYNGKGSEGWQRCHLANISTKTSEFTYNTRGRSIGSRLVLSSSPIYFVMFGRAKSWASLYWKSKEIELKQHPGCFGYTKE